MQKKTKNKKDLGDVKQVDDRVDGGAVWIVLGSFKGGVLLYQKSIFLENITTNTHQNIQKWESATHPLQLKIC